MDVSAAVQELIDRQVGEGHQIGVQVAAYRSGEPWFDVAAGLMGPEDARAVEADSLFLSFSSTKGIAALAVHQLADQGVLDLDAPVAHYWPEFTANGKGSLTVAEAISHQGGLHAMPEPFAPEHITDWEAGVARTAAAMPAYEPGTATGYHAVTFGWIVGGIVAGATGRHVQHVIHDNIARPLGLEDELFVGIPANGDVDDRLTTLELLAAGDGLPIPDDADFYKAMPKAMWPYFNTMPFRTACLPSGNGHFTARALARMYGALANGGEIDDVRLISPAGLERIGRLETDRVDRVLGVPLRKSAGFFLGGLGLDLKGNMVHGPMGPSEAAFGHPGAGGSIGFADPTLGLGVGVTLNKMQYPMPGEGVTLEICDLIRELTA
ncbi:MAG: serine hydrolase [Actinomycetota bacterium]|nr:serine hydrolase [Actinomycetota bacterium]